MGPPVSRKRRKSLDARQKTGCSAASSARQLAQVDEKTRIWEHRSTVAEAVLRAPSALERAQRLLRKEYLRMLLRQSMQVPQHIFGFRRLIALPCPTNHLRQGFPRASFGHLWMMHQTVPDFQTTRS